LFFKNITLMGSTYGPQQASHGVVGRFASKELSAVVDSRMPFAELAAAHRQLEERKIFGKVVVSL
jgi:NADPH:quinone reductase-like Zn-dependent oxidoreductase